MEKINEKTNVKNNTIVMNGIASSDDDSSSKSNVSVEEEEPIDE